MQADWKPEAPERFDDINELVKSVETLKIDNNEKKGWIFHKCYVDNIIILLGLVWLY